MRSSNQSMWRRESRDCTQPSEDRNQSCNLGRTGAVAVGGCEPRTCEEVGSMPSRADISSGLNESE
jgi:hypothetical protein